MQTVIRSRREEPIGSEIGEVNIHHLLAKLYVMCGRDSSGLLKKIDKCVSEPLQVVQTAYQQ